MKILIIGGGVAGTNLAKKLVDKNKGFEITLIKKETYPSYSPCGIPDVLSGRIPKIESILKGSLDNYLTNHGVMIKSCKVNSLDLEKKIVETETGVLNYDLLVLATGRMPKIPKIEGIQLPGVYTICDLEDARKLYEALNEAKKAVIIGAGPIGVECAEGFRTRKIKTTLIESKSHILPNLLDEDMAALVKSRLEACAVELFTSEEVFSINGNERVESVSLKEKEIKAELVLIAIGIKPNTKLAQKAGIEIGKYGGILVDSKQRVRKNGKWLNDVYALGDCVEVKDRITGVYTLSPIVSTAVLQARVIAENICGEDTSVDSYLSPYIMRVGDLEIGKVGLSLKQTEEMGINVKVGKATGHTKVNYYPDAKKLTIKLVSDGEYLLGAQIVGGEDVKERINAITSLIHSKIKVKDILYMERCFTPSLCTSRDAFQKAIEEIIIS